jgi:outer membrane protein TolC
MPTSQPFFCLKSKTRGTIYSSTVRRYRKASLLWVLVSVGALGQPMSAFLTAAQTSLDARVAQGTLARAESQAGASWSGLLPSLVASGAWTHNQFDAVLEQPRGDGTTRTVTIVPKNQFDATLRAELPLLNAQGWLSAAAAVSAVDGARARAQASWAVLQRQAVAAYAAAAGAQQVLRVAQHSTEVAIASLKQAQQRQAAGVANELETVRAEAEVERARQAEADAQALVATSSRALHSLTGLEPTLPLTMPEDDLHAELPLAALEPKAELLPSVAAAKHEADSATRTQVAAGLLLVPTVTAQFTQRLTNATGFQDAAAVYNAGVGFAWRLDAAGISGWRTQAATAQVSQLSAERARQQALDQVHSDWHQVKAAVEKMKSGQAQLVAALRAQLLAKERYQAGVATQLDVIQANRDVFSAEVGQVRAGFELFAARASLRLSTGSEP